MAALDEPQLRHWLGVAEDLAGQAGSRMLGPRPRRVETKADAADLVTEVDREIEAMVRRRLTSFAGHRMIGEEFGAVGPEGGLLWYVDPLDGTANYASDLGWSSFSIALVDGAGLAVGVVANPYRGETFSAARGLGATLNGQPLRCPPASTLAGRLVLTELAAQRPWEGFDTLLGNLAAHDATLRVMGSSALSLVMTAAGRAAATVLGDFHTLDGAAGALIARESGAFVADRGPVPGSGTMVVAAPGVVRELAGCVPWPFAGEGGLPRPE